jgi:hypothetical protein
MRRGRKSGRKREVVRDWRRIVRDQESSGVSVPVFCRVHGLPASTFYSQRRQLCEPAVRAEHISPPRPRFIPVVLPKESAEAAPPQKKADLGTAPLELVHPGGIVLRIPAGCDLESLRSVLRLLDEKSEARPC